MADQTFEFTAIVKEKQQKTPGAGTPGRALKKPETKTTTTTAAFVHAASEIANDIRRVHAAAATATPASSAEGDRDRVRATPESLLRQCSENVDALEQLIETSTEAARSGEITKDTVAHMKAIVSSLYTRIEEAAEMLKTKRIAHLERERSRSARYSSVAPVPPSTLTQRSRAKEDEKADDADKELEEENVMMVKRMKARADDALRGIERQIAEISEMQRIVATKALEQAEDIDALHEQARRSVEAVAESNEALARATRSRRGLMWWLDCNTLTIVCLVSMGSSLLFFNWLHF